MAPEVRPREWEQWRWLKGQNEKGPRMKTPEDRLEAILLIGASTPKEREGGGLSYWGPHLHEDAMARGKAKRLHLWGKGKETNDPEAKGIL